MDDNKSESRTVKYHKHGTLTKNINFKTSKPFWVFETAEEKTTFEGEEFDLITILDDLSVDGFELVTGSNDEYILRTKDEIEETREYFFDDYDEDTNGNIEDES